MSEMNPYTVPKSAIESSQGLPSKLDRPSNVLLRISLVITYLTLLLIALLFTWGLQAGLMGVLFNGVSLVATTLVFVAQLILSVSYSLNRTDSIFNWQGAVMLFDSVVLFSVWVFTYILTSGIK